MVNVIYAASAAATLAGAAYDYVVVGGGNVLFHNSISTALTPMKRYCRAGSCIAVCMIRFCLNVMTQFFGHFVQTY